MRVSNPESNFPPMPRSERAAWAQLPIQAALTLPIEREGIVTHLMMLNTVDSTTATGRSNTSDACACSPRCSWALSKGKKRWRAARAPRRRCGPHETRLAAGAELAGLAFYEVNTEAGYMFVDDRLCDMCGIPDDSGRVSSRSSSGSTTSTRTIAPACSTSGKQMHNGTIDRLSIEYRYCHPARGERWIHHVAGAAARRPRRPGDSHVRRAARHHGAPPVGGGAAAVARGNRAAEGSPAGGDGLSRRPR